jgi:hypothetical protein
MLFSSASETNTLKIIMDNNCYVIKDVRIWALPSVAFKDRPIVFLFLHRGSCMLLACVEVYRPYEVLVVSTRSQVMPSSNSFINFADRDDAGSQVTSTSGLPNHSTFRYAQSCHVLLNCHGMDCAFSQKHKLCGGYFYLLLYPCACIASFPSSSHI